ncbi:MAG: YraN family protein [Muribaculaceae bacterium]|nr:YraN family protein [Muribaculaceae bacterium]
MPNTKKQQAQEAGRLAEKAAIDYLTIKGYAIKETRWRPAHGKGEIDIIAAMDNTIVFVEVKARREGLEEAVAAVDLRKARNMSFGADTYLRQQPYWYQYRYDIIAVDLAKSPFGIEHIEDAFLSPLFTK